MPALGEEFRSAREARGLSLSDVAEQIHIRSVYLAASRTKIGRRSELRSTCAASCAPTRAFSASTPKRRSPASTMLVPAARPASRAARGREPGAGRGAGPSPSVLAGRAGRAGSWSATCSTSTSRSSSPAQRPVAVHRRVAAGRVAVRWRPRAARARRAGADRPRRRPQPHAPARGPADAALVAAGRSRRADQARGHLPGRYAQVVHRQSPTSGSATPAASPFRSTARPPSRSGKAGDVVEQRYSL